MRSMSFVLLLAIVAGCAPVATQGPRPRSTSAEPATGLFPSDAALLADDDIARILDAQWTVPEHVRIALLQLEHESELEHWYGSWRASASRREGGIQTAVTALTTLRAMPGVFDASYLPSFLLPPQISVGVLREAAARYQADWVFVFTSTVRAHPDFKVFGKDEVHGLCLVESALLDTRTGLIPFTSRATREIHVKERDGESMEALVLRAEQEAVDAAMAQNAQALASFVAMARES